MKFKELLIKLAPSYAKRSIISELEQITDICDNYTKPSWELFTKWVKETKDLSTAITEFELKFKKRVKNVTVYDAVTKSIDNISLLTEHMARTLDEKFAEDITKASMSAYALNVFKLMNLMSFTLKYTRLLIIKLTDDQHSYVSDQNNFKLSKQDVKYIDTNIYAYIYCIEVLSGDGKKLIEKLENIPEMIVTAENVDKSNLMPGVDVDPLKLNFISPKFNPFMLVGSVMVKYQADKYKQAQADLKEIQCRLLHLKQLAQDGKEDARLEKQIEYYTNLNNKLKAKIEDMEESYGISD